MSKENYYAKYNKYKTKYITLKNQLGGLNISVSLVNYTIMADKAEILCGIVSATIEEQLGRYDSERDRCTLNFNEDKTRIIGIQTNVSQQGKFGIDARILSKIIKTDGIIEKDFSYYVNRSLLQSDEAFHEVISFFDSMDSDQLYEYLCTNRKTNDHDKTIFHLLARHGNLDMLFYLCDRLGEERFSYFLTISDSIGRIPLHHAICAINNIFPTFMFIYDNTPIDTRNTTDHKGYNAPSWFVIRSLNKSLHEPLKSHMIKKLNELYPETIITEESTINYNTVLPDE